MLNLATIKALSLSKRQMAEIQAVIHLLYGITFVIVGMHLFLALLIDQYAEPDVIWPISPANHIFSIVSIIRIPGPKTHQFSYFSTLCLQHV
jgi:hypothetical protein